MTEENKALLKSKIETSLKELKTDIEELKQLTKPISPDDAIGRVSRMDAINNKSVNDKALRQAKAKLTKLKVALNKIDEEGFGQCKLCNQEIPIPRLMFMPESSRCVKCADR